MPLRGLVLLGLVASAVAVTAGSASGDAAGAEVGRVSRDGITVPLPTHWHAVDRKLTPCVDPSERLTVAGHGALVMLQERRRPVAGEFPARPAAFSLHGRPEYMECCAPLSRPGWMLRFEEKGRGLYAYVYLGEHDTRSEALSILDGIRIESQSS